MFDLVLDAFGSQITQRALVGGLLAATVTALVGTWIVVRGLAFFGDALAHGVIPGIALAALGVVILSRQPTFAGDLTGFLFGDVLGVGDDEIRLGVVALVVTVVGLVLGHRAFLALSVSRDKATTLGLRPDLAHAAMLTLIALSVVTSFRVVGTLLVFGFLVAPPATAVLLARRIPTAMALAVGFGCLAVVVGLTVSYHADTAASATVAGVAVAQFFVVLALTTLARHLARRHRRPAAT